MVLYPEERTTLCPRCKKHTAHKCTIYKKGKRRYDRKQRGYGGQTKPIFHKKAKVTKKNMIKMTCKQCKCVTYKLLKRCHKLELQKPGQSKKAKGAYEF